jgi:SAM-dependent methyltransferase
VASRVYRLLDRATRPSRERNAALMFYLGRSAPVDGAIASAFFSIGSRQWGVLGQDDRHVAAIAEGLDQVTTPSRVVDTGTGAGAAAAVVARRFPGATVTGIDSSAAMLRQARRRHPLPNLEFRRGNVLRLPFADGDVDLVVSLNAVSSPSEVHRVVREGGEVLVGSSVVRQPHDERSTWVARWRECGFERVATGVVPGGSFEVYRRGAG